MQKIKYKFNRIIFYMSIINLLGISVFYLNFHVHTYITELQKR